MTQELYVLRLSRGGRSVVAFAPCELDLLFRLMVEHWRYVALWRREIVRWEPELRPVRRRLLG